MEKRRRNVDGAMRAPNMMQFEPPGHHRQASAGSMLAGVRPAAGKRRRMRLTWQRRAALMAVVVFLVSGVFVGARFLLAAQKIITRNSEGGAPALLGEIDPTKLRGEGDGRINVLLLGIGGVGHEAPNLSDSIMLVSIDPRSKDVAMLSIPRDLYVPIKDHGWNKINTANALGENRREPGGGAALAKQTVSRLFDVPIHYYVRVDFNGFKKAIDAVGGIDVDVEETLSDPTYPNGRGGHSKLYIPKGRRHMDGELALKYARCRHGSCGNDFGRASRQQKVLMALREKALQLETLTNPGKLAALIDALGDHVMTDVQLAEAEKLARLAKDIDTSKVVNKVLDTTDEGLLKSGRSPVGAYIAVPRTGNYNEIKEFVHSLFVDGYIKEEGAAVEVQNGTPRSGLAAAVGKTLKGYGYNVSNVKSAASQSQSRTVLYDYSEGKKPFTVNYLERRFGVRAQRANRPEGGPDVTVILGADYRASK